MAKKIFIVDDDRDMVDSLKMVLEASGYETGASYEASEALEKAKKYKPDLIILDVMFPENPSEGFELARKFHDDESINKVPVIIFSAINERFNLGFSEKDRDESWLPVKHFVEKPIQPGKFIALVKEIIGN